MVAKPSEGEDDARRPRLLYLGRRWFVAARDALDRIARDYGLTAGDYNLLYLLDRHGACSAAEIARIARITPQASTQQIAQLAAKDMLVRQENPANRRIVLIKLSQHGQIALAAIDRGADALEAELTSDLAPGDSEVIRRFLARRPGVPADVSQHSEPRSDAR